MSSRRTWISRFAALPREYGDILQWKLGLTDLAKGVFGSDRVLAKSHFDTARLYRHIEEYRPGVLAFTRKRAAGEFLGPSGMGCRKSGRVALDAAQSPRVVSRPRPVRP